VACPRFLIEDGAVANYAAISANVALAGIEGGHDKYDMYLRSEADLSLLHCALNHSCAPM
jgi:hypothetical protein